MKKTVTMQTLINEQNERKERRAELERKAAEYSRSAEEYSARAEEEAKAGNVAGYSENRRKAEDARDAAHVAEVQRDNMPTCFDRGVVMEAWGAYAAEYNKQFDAALAKYNETLDSLREQLAALVNMQEKALQMRAKAGVFAGYLKGKGDADDGKVGMFAMHCFPNEGGKWTQVFNALFDTLEARSRAVSVIGMRSVLY